jgi:DNA-binding transcriptional ArsR family regulator
MKEQNSSSLFRMRNAEAVKLLARAEERRFLEPFLAAEKTASEAAVELGVKLDAITYRIRVLEAAGLLSVTRKEARKGRAIKYYKAVAEGFQVSFTDLPFEDLETLFKELDAPMRNIALRGAARVAREGAVEGWVMRFYRDPSGRANVDMAPPETNWKPENLLEPSIPPVMLNWVPLHLTNEEAKGLQAELFALLGRYLGKQGDVTHVLGLTLSPVTSEDLQPEK